VGSAQRPPGMMDVARRAGVSHQTVSRVLNGTDPVRPETRERVLEAIEELGYRRNMSARALVTSRSRLIGVIVADSEYSGPNLASTAIQTAARERGYATVIAAIRDTGHREVSQVTGMLLDHAVEGIIVIAPQPPLVEELSEIGRRVPVVVIADGVEVTDGMHPVSVDQHRGARFATEHLIELGHQRIAHVGGPSSWFDARERETGWRETLTAEGLTPPDVIRGDWSSESGYAAGIRLVDEGLPDAVFCANDYMALGLLAAFSERGVAVPDEVSVVGFDDITGSAHFQPALTTVRQPFHTLGETSVGMLLDAIAESPVIPRRISPMLEVRASPAPRR